MVTLFDLPEPVVPIYEKLVDVISAGRDINPSEYGLIASLASQYYLHGQALNSVINDGVVLVSTTNHGTVEKSNPQISVYKDTGVQIQKLSAMLVMTQKEMKALATEDNADDEDPLGDLLKKRNKDK